jgi:hypothetical protein
MKTLRVCSRPGRAWTVASTAAQSTPRSSAARSAQLDASSPTGEEAWGAHEECFSDQAM